MWRYLSALVAGDRRPAGEPPPDPAPPRPRSVHASPPALQRRKRMSDLIHRGRKCVDQHRSSCCKLNVQLPPIAEDCVSLMRRHELPMQVCNGKADFIPQVASATFGRPEQKRGLTSRATRSQPNHQFRCSVAPYSLQAGLLWRELRAYDRAARQLALAQTASGHAGRRTRERELAAHITARPL